MMTYYVLKCLFIDFGKERVWLSVSLFLIGKFGISASFGSIFVSTPETFPTNIRSEN